jgi:hypothetical protein
LGVISVPPVTSGSRQADDAVAKKLLFNMPTSPLKLTISSNREFYSVDNHSPKRVVSYRLGCVVEDGNNIKIKYKAKPKLVDIAPLDDSQNRITGKAYTIYGDKDFHSCIKKKAKLTVLEVGFSDGSLWLANL